METQYHPLPQPDDIPVREKEDAMGSYFMMFASLAAGLPLPILNMVAAIIYYYLHKKKSRFIQFHTLQSLISQIPVTLMNAAGVIWFIVILAGDLYFTRNFKGYMAMLIIANLTYIIFSLVAATRARRGEFFYFLFFGRYAYHVAYQINDREEKQVVNEPPKI
jgi:uncharacterized membrane protein